MSNLKLDITFQNKEAKELFLVVLEEYEHNITTLISTLATSKKYGPTEPYIEITGDDTAVVGTVKKDKGKVISANGFVDYDTLNPGDKYGEISTITGRSGLVVFSKSGDGNADVPIGIAPSILEVYREFNNEEELSVDTIQPV